MGVHGLLQGKLYLFILTRIHYVFRSKGLSSGYIIRYWIICLKLIHFYNRVDLINHQCIYLLVNSGYVVLKTCCGMSIKYMKWNYICSKMVVIVTSICCVRCWWISLLISIAVKGKLPLCLATSWRHMGEWMYTSIFFWPRHWREVSGHSCPGRFTPRKIAPYPLDRRLGGPQSRSGRHAEENIVDPTGTRASTPRSSSP
jgi:hypothetical protein